MNKTETKTEADIAREKRLIEDDKRRLAEACPHLTYWQKKHLLYAVLFYVTKAKIKCFIGSIPRRWLAWQLTKVGYRYEENGASV